MVKYFDKSYIAVCRSGRNQTQISELKVVCCNASRPPTADKYIVNSPRSTTCVSFGSVLPTMVGSSMQSPLMQIPSILVLQSER